MCTKIYIIGKISGLTAFEVKEKFDLAVKTLKNIGIPKRQLVNPLDFGFAVDEPFCGALKGKCLTELSKCTAVYILHDWRDSIGSRIEITEAMRLKKDIFWKEQNGLVELRNLVETGII